MNDQAVATRENMIENRIDREISNSIVVGTGGITFSNAGEVMEYAKMMAVSGSAVPRHLRGQPGACLGIIDDAIRFQTSPYALARKSYFVNDNLAYEAQVLAGIVNRFAPLIERPNIEFEGEGPDRVCIVTGTFRDGAVREYRSPKFRDINPKNSPLWKNDPDQQHSYFSLRGFARRHCPEILLGMYDIEEMRDAQMRNVTPQRPTVMDRLKGADADEGFSHAHVTEQTAQIIETQESEPDSSPGPDDGAARTDEPPSPESPPPQGDGGSIDPYVDARRNSMGSEPSREKGDPK